MLSAYFLLSSNSLATLTDPHPKHCAQNNRRNKFIPERFIQCHPSDAPAISCAPRNTSLLTRIPAPIPVPTLKKITSLCPAAFPSTLRQVYNRHGRCPLIFMSCSANPLLILPIMDNHPSPEYWAPRLFLFLDAQYRERKYQCSYSNIFL